MADIFDKLRESIFRCFDHVISDPDAVDVIEININGKGRIGRPKKKWVLLIEIDNNKDL